jgi:hypothetical protein
LRQEALAFAESGDDVDSKKDQEDIQDADRLFCILIHRVCLQIYNARKSLATDVALEAERLYNDHKDGEKIELQKAKELQLTRKTALFVLLIFLASVSLLKSRIEFKK